MSTATRHVNGPRPLSTTLEKAAGPAFARHGAVIATLIRHWPQLLGPTLAPHTAPSRVVFPRGRQSEGTLTVACASAFQTEMAHMEPLILERVTACFGYPLIVRIRTAPATWSPPKPKTRCVLPPAQAEALDRRLAEVDDDALRVALRALGEAVMVGR